MTISEFLRHAIDTMGAGWLVAMAVGFLADSTLGWCIVVLFLAVAWQ